MIRRILTRREFIDFSILSATILLSSCSKSQERIILGLQKRFYPDSFKKCLQKSWIKKNINFSNLYLNDNFDSSQLLIVNDGWINQINYDLFQNISSNLKNKLDERALAILNNFPEKQRKKILPIGVMPYVVVIKNNKSLRITADQSWDFLLSESLKKKIILPDSPRVVMSIAKKMNTDNSLRKLLDQAFAFDDKNALNWLINSDINLAIMPYSLCFESFKIDSRLSFIFPNQGVPLIWNFILTKSLIYEKNINEWLSYLDNKMIIDKLRLEGFFIPFNFESYDNYYGQVNSFDRLNNLPSHECWENSWSFKNLSIKEKKELENIWTMSSIP